MGLDPRCHVYRCQIKRDFFPTSCWLLFSHVPISFFFQRNDLFVLTVCSVNWVLSSYIFSSLFEVHPLFLIRLPSPPSSSLRQAVPAFDEVLIPLPFLGTISKRWNIVHQSHGIISFFTFLARTNLDAICWPTAGLFFFVQHHFPSTVLCPTS